MKLSARNQFEGKVVEVKEGVVNASVKIEIADGNIVTSTISLEAVKELELVEGRSAVAVIKATSVLLANGVVKLSARNQFSGKVVEIKEGAVNSIVKVQLTGSNIIYSTVTNEAIKELELVVGCEATAVVKATEVLIMA